MKCCLANKNTFSYLACIFLSVSDKIHQNEKCFCCIYDKKLVFFMRIRNKQLRCTDKTKHTTIDLGIYL